ncbi:AraC-like DNA-binding protein [Mucilaginibacter frigoritolerans]|uniref:AraC-like DNA-binding protein n=1 Tax=Mucilaginibacter frigoritolerans TaxID=652788 RepID=A0A562UBK5_9SPHI|nr:helix-turn-helix domain-containing protein [Mucilaginibacter frigoritolerans]TWJ03164.1 AraC-like DNA-binding protein [Mucilaginibacter frigoritolerans]
MPKKNQPIPVNHFGDESGAGISIERLAFENLPELGEWEQPERHDRHSFFLLEKGSVAIEIDFERYQIQSPGAIYMHPDQVHRITGFENVTVTAWAITNETLNSEYLQLLEDIRPAAPVLLNPETFGLLSEAASLCIKIAERKKDLIYQSILKHHGNALVGLIIATYTAQSKPADKLTRSELVTKAFREDLAHHFTRLKRPTDYAEKLHLSAAYLNECVKSMTGHPVSYHIQQRVILEAKRLLYHSDQSLKEIAAGLGYDDYPYFSRLFTKVAGIAPLIFRNKNRD